MLNTNHGNVQKPKTVTNTRKLQMQKYTNSENYYVHNRVVDTKIQLCILYILYGIISVNYTVLYLCIIQRIIRAYYTFPNPEKNLMRFLEQKILMSHTSV